MEERRGEKIEEGEWRESQDRKRKGNKRLDGKEMN